jgi:exportin-2 (importin alpha re-exporter)
MVGMGAPADDIRVRALHLPNPCNVPALVRIWKALLLRGGDVIAQGGQVNGLLGVFQRLVGSKANDIWALEVVQGLYEALPL